MPLDTPIHMWEERPKIDIVKLTTFLEEKLGRPLWPAEKKLILDKAEAWENE